MIFLTKLAYTFDPKSGHRLVLHLAATDNPESHFALRDGSGAFNHFSCELLRRGMDEAVWREAVTAVMAEDEKCRQLPNLDLDVEDITRLNTFYRA